MNAYERLYSKAPQYRISRDQQILSIIGGYSLLPIQEIKRNNLKGPKFSNCYWRIFITLGSSIRHFFLKMRDLTVFLSLASFN